MLGRTSRCTTASARRTPIRLISGPGRAQALVAAALARAQQIYDRKLRQRQQPPASDLSSEWERAQMECQRGALAAGPHERQTLVLPPVNVTIWLFLSCLAQQRPSQISGRRLLRVIRQFVLFLSRRRFGAAVGDKFYRNTSGQRCPLHRPFHHLLLSFYSGFRQEATFGLIPNGLKVALRDGTVHRFVVTNREGWVGVLISAAEGTKPLAR
jgi:hypothetical protein